MFKITININYFYFIYVQLSLGFENWLLDSGDIREKEHLPIKQVRFGDTGTPLDEKEGRFKVGPLMCEGDGKLIYYFQ